MARSPIISLFGSTIRPELWMRIYNSLSSNEIPFEMIFVGNNPPEFEMPENCHFIYSKTKPAQCFEIGARYSTGDLIMHFGDDCVFSPHALDKLYEEFIKMNDEKAMVSCRFVFEGEDLTDKHGYYWTDEKSSPRMPAGSLMKKRVWEKIGGIDKRFIALYWDLDIAMRMYEIGGRLVFAKDAYVEELTGREVLKRKFPILKNPLIYKVVAWGYHKISKPKVPPARLFSQYGVSLDRPLLDSFWVGESLSEFYCEKEGRGKLSKKRLHTVEPFKEEHFLTVSQGPKGKWT